MPIEAIEVVGVEPVGRQVEEQVTSKTKWTLNGFKFSLRFIYDIGIHSFKLEHRARNPDCRGFVSFVMKLPSRRGVKN